MVTMAMTRNIIRAALVLFGVLAASGNLVRRGETFHKGMYDSPGNGSFFNNTCQTGDCDLYMSESETWYSMSDSEMYDSPGSGFCDAGDSDSMSESETYDSESSQESTGSQGGQSCEDICQDVEARLSKAGFRPVKLESFEVLTFRRGHMTSPSRIGRPRPQLMCLPGGNVGCNAFIPEVIRCHNRHTRATTWACHFEDRDHNRVLDYMLGKADLTCEIFHNTEYVEKDSCQLQFTIEPAEKYCPSKPQPQHSATPVKTAKTHYAETTTLVFLNTLYVETTKSLIIAVLILLTVVVAAALQVSMETEHTPRRSYFRKNAGNMSLVDWIKAVQLYVALRSQHGGDESWEQYYTIISLFCDIFPNYIKQLR